MTCEQQPSLGDSAQGEIDYTATFPSFMARLRVFGQSFTDDWPRPADVRSNVILDEDLGMLAAEARSTAVTFEEERTGRGGMVIFPTSGENPEQLEFSVTNPSGSHSMIGLGFVVLNFNYRAEYQSTFPRVRVDGSNVVDHELADLPLSIHALNASILDDGPVLTETVGGMSVIAAIGPNGTVEPGTTWSDTINFSVLALQPFLAPVLVQPANPDADPPTPDVFENREFQPELEVFDWTIRAVGMLL